MNVYFIMIQSEYFYLPVQRPRIVLPVKNTMFKSHKRNKNDSKPPFRTFQLKLQATTILKI